MGIYPYIKLPSEYINSSYNFKSIRNYLSCAFNSLIIQSSSKYPLLFFWLNPIILHGSSQLVKILLQKIHRESGHLGRETVLAVIKETFHVIKVNKIVRQIIDKCVICRKVQRRPEIAWALSELSTSFILLLTSLIRPRICSSCPWNQINSLKRKKEWSFRLTFDSIFLIHQWKIIIANYDDQR